jgi:Putative Actinobacterial Holin-X, holin superfamily III
MSEEFKKIESLLEQVKDYANTRVDKLKLSIAEKLSKTISDMIATMLAGLVFFAFVLFGSVAGAIALGQWLDKLWLGFLLVAGFYLVAGLIIWKAKNRLLRIPIMNSLIEKLFSNDSEDEKD